MLTLILPSPRGHDTLAAIQRFPMSFSNSDSSYPVSQGSSVRVTPSAQYPSSSDILGDCAQQVCGHRASVSCTSARPAFVTWLRRPHSNRGAIMTLWVSGCWCQLGPSVQQSRRILVLSFPLYTITWANGSKTLWGTTGYVFAVELQGPSSWESSHLSGQWFQAAVERVILQRTVFLIWGDRLPSASCSSSGEFLGL